MIRVVLISLLGLSIITFATGLRELSFVEGRPSQKGCTREFINGPPSFELLKDDSAYGSGHHGPPSGDDYPSGAGHPTSGDDHPSGAGHPSSGDDHPSGAGSAEDYPVEMAEYGNGGSGHDHYGGPSDGQIEKEKEHCRAMHTLLCKRGFSEHRRRREFKDYINKHHLPCALKDMFPAYLEYMGLGCDDSSRDVCDMLFSYFGSHDDYGYESAGDFYGDGLTDYGSEFDYGSGGDYGDSGVDYGSTGDYGTTGDLGTTSDYGSTGDYGTTGDVGSTGDYGSAATGTGDYGSTGDVGSTGDYGSAATGTGDYGSTGDSGTTAGDYAELDAKQEPSLVSPLKRLIFGK